MVTAKKVKAKWLVKVPQGAQVKVGAKQKIKTGEEIMVVEGGKIESFDASLVLLRLNRKAIDEIEKKWSGTRVSKDDLLYSSGGVFAKKIFSPLEGEFVNVDELLNINIRVGGSEKKIISPTDAVVSKIEEDKITLEFSAIEFKGEGLVEGRVWSECDLKIVEKLGDISSNQAKKVILVRNLDEIMLIKSEVVGVAGLVVIGEIEDDCWSETSLPVLRLDEKEAEALLKVKDMGKRLLLNSRVGKLFLVLE